MRFLSWHYSVGFKYYLRRGVYALTWIMHFFSLPILLQTLFSPWKRLAVTDSTPGFSFEKFFETVSFNLISRVIGFLVRSTLFVVGFLSLSLAMFVILSGVAIWLLCPFLSLSLYRRYLSQSQFVAQDLWLKLHKDPASALKVLLASPAGEFLCRRLQVSASDLASKSHPPGSSPPRPASFFDLVNFYVSNSTWTDSALHSLHLVPADLTVTAAWWDELQPTLAIPESFGQPGVGAELLFGYTPTLDRYTTNLSRKQTFAHHLIGRTDLMPHLERILLSGKSVVLTGLPGVGRQTAVFEFANRAREGLLSPKLVYRRVLELDYNFLLGEHGDLNSKKSSLSAILSEAVSAGNIILVVRDLHRLTSPESEGLDFTDVWEKYLADASLQIIAVSSTADYEQFISPHPRLRKFLEPVEVVPATPHEALEIVIQASINLEPAHKVFVTEPALRQIVDGSDKFMTDIPFPEKALEILDAVITYAHTHLQTVITPDQVDTVLSEKTGVSPARLSPRQKTLLADLEKRIHTRVIGQDLAVTAVSQSLRSRLLGTKNDRRPVGSFLFLGPTGVGKTQMAKTLAEIYYGSSENMLRFDMAEFQGEEGIARLIGSAARRQPGSLTTAIKNHPASLLLLDEIEKAPPQIYNLFLSLLDEGSLTDAFDRKINCRHLFVIATSNAGAEFIRQLVTRKTPPDQLSAQVLDHVQSEHLFSPEFLNRFDGVVVFQPLSQDELVQVAGLMLTDLANQLKTKDITLQITPELCAFVASEGYKPEFGARTIRRLVDLTLGDQIAQALLKNELNEGDTFQVVPQGHQFVVKRM